MDARQSSFGVVRGDRWAGLPASSESQQHPMLLQLPGPWLTRIASGDETAAWREKRLEEPGTLRRFFRGSPCLQQNLLPSALGGDDNRLQGFHKPEGRRRPLPMRTVTDAV